MKFIYFLFFLTFLSGILFLPSAFAENVPDWVKNTAGWWATDAISETEFVNAVEFLVKENIIQVNVSQTSETSQSVPGWVKNTAGWWATDVISETEFVNAIAYLIENGIIMISSLDEKYNLCSDTNELSAEIRMQTKLVIKEEWRQLCYDFYDNSYAGYEAITKQESVNYNSHGFRGPEISKEKPDNTYRIFAVGGSTTHGLPLVADNETWSYYLQKKFDERDFGFDIEVLNTGMSGHTSITESKLIKDNLIDFSPDLIVVFDGLNDASWVANPWHDWWEPQSEIAWKDRWSEICDLGKRNGFDTIITVQPFYKSGFQVLTKSDYEQYVMGLSAYGNQFSVSDAYPLYLNQLPELSKNCKKAVDMSSLFDKIPENLFVDQVHVASLGNKIIAEEFYQIILPIIEKTQYFESSVSNIISKNDISNLLNLHNLNLNNVNFENLDISGIDFSGKDLENVVFYNANMNDVDFTNANLSGANFLGGSVDNTNFSGANIENARFVKTKLGNANFSSAVLDETIFFRVDFSRTDLSNASMKDTKIFESSFNGMNLTGISFIGTNLTNSNLSNSNLSGNDLARTILTGVDLSNSNLTGVDLTGLDLTNTNLSGVDLTGMDLTGTILDCIITTIKIPCINFVDTNLENANLDHGSFVQVDFTKIKNKSLAGADLSKASFAHSDLSGVNLADVILEGTNFWKADLSGVDFTVTDVITDGLSFIKANLSNSNFESVNLSPKEPYFQVFQNKAHLNNLSSQGWANDALERELDLHLNTIIISTEVRGNDLAVTYVFFNNFAHANLENANFKNANLMITNFNSANLTNVDLSGANLNGAYLGYADLSNANLEGTNLQHAILDNAILSNANLKCINHPICNSD